MTSQDGGPWSIPSVTSGGCNTSVVTAVMRSGITTALNAGETLQFSNAQGSISLPVTILAFFAEPNQDNIKLSWTTGSEMNNHGFEIQRATKGENWLKIGWVKGNGTTSTLNNYKVIDPNVA